MAKYKIIKLFGQISGAIIVAPDANSAIKRAKKLSQQECYPLQSIELVDLAAEIKESPIVDKS